MTDKELDDLSARVSEAMDVPEPSPLFWEHFPARVRAAVAAEPAPRIVWWRRPALAYALSAALAGGAGYLAWTSRAVPVAPVAETPAVAADTPTPYTVGSVDEETGDAGWDVVTSVAATAGADTLREAGFGVPMGGAEAAVETMTDAERTQLAALLRAEMSGDDSGS